jgi:hypothetical protein
VIISVVIRPAAQPPMVFALILIDRQIANAAMRVRGLNSL